MNQTRKIAWTREERWGLVWPILVVAVLVVILVAIVVTIAAFVAYLDVMHEPASVGWFGEPEFQTQNPAKFLSFNARFVLVPLLIEGALQP